MEISTLLDLQEIDTETEQLLHKRSNLEARRTLAAARAEQQECQNRIDGIAMQRVEVLTRQKRLEDEAAIVRSKADRDDNRLYSGEITAIRDLQAMQDEIAGLRSRQSVLEEQAIAALLEAEELEGQAQTLQQHKDSGDQRLTVIEAELGVAEAEIDEQVAALASKRDEVAAFIDDAVIAGYERLRVTFGPSTVVRFDPATGCGCPQDMPAVEVARIKRCDADAVLDCSECGRLVLR
ncbi:MAG: hypothetical protein OXC59_00170 [Acidimicrobiaceae bacterium]|nr:hypothetical protein [Acidimicrobiaceae bacterium]